MTIPPTIPNPNNPKGIAVLDLEGGQVYIIPVSVAGNNQFDTGAALLVGGLGATTAGVTDTTDKRFVTDAELAILAALTALTGAEALLSSTPNVNLNQDPETNLYTVPAGKSALITKVVLRNASTSLTTASISFGFNAGTDNDVIANATHTELTDNTLYTVLTPKTGAKVGVAAGKLSVICNTKQGGAATCTVDVFGYLF